MRVQQLLEHHGIAVNPFAEEDAQSDPVFKDRCRDLTYHPAWDKVYGNPSDPATSIVFGEKGAGKTAMRMQMVGRIALHNARPRITADCFVIEYDDFNPFLDHFADRLSARKQRDPAKVLANGSCGITWTRSSSLGVTSLVDRLLGVPHPTGPDANQIGADRLRSLDRHQKRDLLLLVACYDNSTRENVVSRWSRLRAQTSLSNLAIVVGPPSRHRCNSRCRCGDCLLPALGLAIQGLAVRGRCPRLGALDRAVVEMAIGRVAGCAKCSRAQTPRRFATPPA